MQTIAVPPFWPPSTQGLKLLTPSGPGIRLRAKAEVLYASPSFSFIVLQCQKVGREGKWSASCEPRYAFRRLVERTMPGYFDMFSCRYGVDNLLTECRQILDLAFVAANWRYTQLVQKQFYRCGVDTWPPIEAWWMAKLAALRPSPTQVSSTAASSSSASPASSHVAKFGQGASSSSAAPASSQAAESRHAAVPTVTPGPAAGPVVPDSCACAALPGE